MIEGIITLISKSRTIDDVGRQKAEETRRDVFARIESVSRDEFFAAGQNGIQPEYRFSVFSAEWNGERECEYNGTRYSIYRTYQPSDYNSHINVSTHEGSITRTVYAASVDRVELYAARRVGVNGKNAD